ncbi:hypothetical protein B296_00039877 [Ensete ventricosum]|uniref:Uncharacterized protein n=1 Tax=Ensete ventricosum TaxID=4639 RepID=A0A426YIS5_ENSVE|nr:hypothetical protein B296_00039877 [Ensete ventricosum]
MLTLVGQTHLVRSICPSVYELTQISYHERAAARAPRWRWLPGGVSSGKSTVVYTSSRFLSLSYSCIYNPRDRVEDEIIQLCLYLQGSSDLRAANHRLAVKRQVLRGTGDLLEQMAEGHCRR